MANHGGLNVRNIMLLGALQSSYLPWLGYFDQIHHCDLFIVYDDLQYTHKDWRNRNRIKTPAGTAWLTVPIHHSGGRPLPLNEAQIADQTWRHQHWDSIAHNYRKAPFFGVYSPELRAPYRHPWHLLGDLNRTLLDRIIELLGISTPVLYSSDHNLEREFRAAYGRDADATDRIVFLCRHFSADRFLQGSAGRGYVQMDKILEAQIDLIFQDYVHPVYRQRFEGFVPYLSIIDLLFNAGPDSLHILTRGRSNQS